LYYAATLESSASSGFGSLSILNIESIAVYTVKAGLH
jgi:hypothetical protein